MTTLEDGPGSAPPAPEDLHDHVIQKLFTLGLRIQDDAARSEPAVAEQINGYAETLERGHRHDPHPHGWAPPAIYLDKPGVAS